VLLTRQAGKHRGGADAEAPTPRDPEQPAAQHARCEVLVRD
jgi:hypothetical protein